MSVLRNVAVPLLFVAAAALSYFGTAIRMGRALEAREAAVDHAYARIAELGDKAGAEMARSLPGDLPLLADACKDKLGSSNATSIVAYVPEAPPDVKENLAVLLANHPRPYDLPHARVLPSRVVAGSMSAEMPFLAIEPIDTLSDHRPHGFEAIKTLLRDDLSPLNWATDVQIEARRGPDVLAARFVAVALVRAAAPPTLVEDRAFQGGLAVLQVRLLDLASGAPVCEGKQIIHMPPEIRGPSMADGKADPSDLATAFDQAIAFGAIHGLCHAGGDALCVETARKVE
jgi:hypothetical protein